MDYVLVVLVSYPWPKTQNKKQEKHKNRKKLPKEKSHNFDIYKKA